MELSPVSDTLRDALVAIYAPHVERRLAELSVDLDEEVAATLAVGREWLAEELTRLLALPHAEQHRGPLEVFQEAMRLPTAALQRRALEPLDRDEVAKRALPGDLYDLAPASSAALGETVWRAHLAWGAEKAAAMSRQGG